MYHKQPYKQLLVELNLLSAFSDPKTNRTVNPL